MPDPARMKTIFGPVFSGRLGRSLGIDLLGRKICNFDCCYCEVGRTTLKTDRREVYVRADLVDRELCAWLETARERPDHITLGGSGEPCLNAEMGRIIDLVRHRAPGIPVAVLTNSSLLACSEVSDALSRADVVLPSLDSLVQEEFVRLNRPLPGVRVSGIADALLAFGRKFPGRILLEILLTQGYNDSEQNLARLAEYIPRLAPDRVDVTTVSRPGTLSQAEPVAPAVLDAWRKRLGPLAGDDAGREAQIKFPTSGFDASAAADAMLLSLSRRPQTSGQLALALHLPENFVRETLATLATTGDITRRDMNGCEFYAAAHLLFDTRNSTT